MISLQANHIEDIEVAHTGLEHAVAEIYSTYGHKVRINRKSMHKFGRYEQLGVTKTAITYWGGDPIRSATNSITHFSSTNAADDQVLRVEGMTISGGLLTFTVQDITLNGQTKTALTTPLARCMRIANVTSVTETAGDVYVYEDDTVTGGVPDTATKIANLMPAEYQSTQFAGTSVAHTNYFIVSNYWVFLNKKQTAAADVEFRVGAAGLGMRVATVGSLNNNSQITHSADPYYIVPPNADLHIYATANTTGVDISAGFAGYFADIVE